MSSLVLIEHMSQPDGVIKPFFGIGDPLLDGNLGQARGLGASDIHGDASGDSVDEARLRALPRLPETADEILRLSSLLGADPASVLLGRDATKKNLRSRPLKDYRVIAFATHGIVAGAFPDLREPGLVLTASPGASEGAADNGYISASEIATLELKADIVLLSVCNTDASDGKSNEFLSGLARSFFFAGAHSLLVSHWSVLSNAAMDFTTAMIEGRERGGETSHPRALRSAMLKLRDNAQSEEARHPGYWGPFEIIGF